MNRRNRVKLGNFLKVHHGFAFSGEGMTDDLTGRPIVVSIGNFDYTGGFRFESTRVREFRGDYPKEFELRAGDLLVVMTCQTAGGEILGIPGMVPDDGRVYLHNQRIGRVECNTDLLNEGFAYYLFLTADVNRQLFNTSSGTKILHTSPGRIADVECQIPPVREQTRIARALRALDDKIAVNERIAAVADKLMLAYLEESTYRGAIDVPLSEVAAFHNKKRVPLSSRERSEVQGPYPYYGAAGVIDHVKEYLFSGPHVLVGEDGTVVTGEGRPVVQYVWGDFWVNNHAHVLTGTTISSELLAISLRFTNVASLVTGAVQPKLNMRNLQRLSLRIPSEEHRHQVERVIARLWETVRLRRDETRTLAALRDTLLPQLMSGRLRVKDAEKIVEDHV